MIRLATLLLLLVSFSTVAAGDQPTMDQLVAHLEKSTGIDLTEEPVFAFMLGGMEGISLAAGQDEVIIIRYDLDVPYQRNLFQKYKKEGITSNGVTDIPFANGSFLLFDYFPTTVTNQIVSAFKKF